MTKTCVSLVFFSLFHVLTCAAQDQAQGQGVKPAEVVTGNFRAQLPAKAPSETPFTAYQIRVAQRYSSLIIELSGDGGDEGDAVGGDADLLLVADAPMKKPQDALFTSVGPTNAERIELRRNTVPSLRDTDYFLYVFHAKEGSGNLELTIQLNLPSDDGLDQLPTLPEGVISHEASGEDVPWLMTFKQSARVNLAMPAGTAPGKTLVRLQVPEGTKALDVNLWGNLSDIDLLLSSPEVDGEQPLLFTSQEKLATEEILVGSMAGDELLPAGDWILTLLRRDQLPSEPLLLRVGMR